MKSNQISLETIHKIKVGSRASKLSQAQVKEILEGLHRYHPKVTFDPIFLKTIGDVDLASSLRNMDKTDFFTRDIDLMQLAGMCRIAIHSAKDLPEPLPKGLKLIALTRGVDPSDSLVLRKGEYFQTLPQGSVIGTSSVRREEAVRRLKSDLTFTEVRGSVEIRLKALDEKKIDGLIIAEAALIRLKLTYLNRIKLSGDSALLQGKLAVVGREDDIEMEKLFNSINCG